MRDVTYRFGSHPVLQEFSLELAPGESVAVVGTPGGRTIINTTLQLILNLIDFEMDIQAAVDAAFDSDIIELENGVFTGEGNVNVNTLGKAVTIRGASVDFERA